MSYANKSYFAKHKLVQQKQTPRTVKQTVIVKKESERQNEEQDSVIKSDSQIQQIVVQRQRQSYSEHFDLQLQDEKSEQEKVYEGYKAIKQKYQNQLVQITKEIEQIKVASENENKKLKHAQFSLQSKNKQLQKVKKKYLQMKQSFEKEQLEQASTQKIQQLQRELQQLHEKSKERIRRLRQEQEQAKQQNIQLKQKLIALKQQYARAINLDSTSFQNQKKRLEEEEAAMKEELEKLEKQSDKIKRDIKKIQQMKPAGTQIHKRYLDLFEKIFISKELEKAERIMSLKQQERKYTIQVNRRKQWLKQKERQLEEKQKRIEQKNKTIDQLTLQIRQKSTLLLTKYQAEADKHKK